MCVLHACRRPAAALKALDKLAADDKSLASSALLKDISRMRGKLMASLEWRHWAAHEEEAARARFPTAMAPLL